MTLYEKIKADLIVAMKAREALKVEVLRGILAAFTNELVANKQKPTEILDEGKALQVIQRLGKQRKDSIEQFTKGERMDLAEKEEAELKIIEEYLPEMMSKDEIKSLAEAKKQEMGIDDKSKMGMLMGAIMKELRGRADGTVVKEVVEKLF